VAASRKGFLEVDLRVRLPDGTRYRERVKSPVQSRSGAKRWGEERERFLAIHGPQEKKEVPTLEEFEQRFISDHVEANRLKPSTAASYKSQLALHIRPTLGRLRLDDIDKKAEQRLKGAMQEFSPKTVNDTLGVLSRLLTCAAEWGVIKSAPRFKKLKAQQTEVEFFDFEDLDRLIEGARKAGPEVLAFVLLGADAGLRRGEIIALEQTDADHRRGLLNVARSDWCGGDRVTEGWQDSTRTDDEAPGRGPFRDPPSARSAGALPARRRAGHRDHAAQLDGTRRANCWDARHGAHPPAAAHVLLAPGDARCTGESHPGAGRPRRPHHHDALHAPVPGVTEPGDPAP
jgi:Phage integrase, N-terminal SAM-like domain